MNRFTLTLPSAELETAWWLDWAQRSGARQRIAVGVLIGVVAAFGFVDRVAFPAVYGALWTARLAMLVLLVPALPVVFGSSVERLARWGQPAVAWLAIVTFGGLFPIGHTIAADATPDQLLLSIPSLLFGLLALFGASGLRFAYAAPIGVGTAIGFVGTLTNSPASTPEFLLLSAAGGGSALVVGFLVSWSREAHARTDFLRRRELERERRRSETLLRNLMPDVLARRLESGPGPHLDRRDATVVFATVTGFDPARYSPLAAVALLDRVIGAIDVAAVAAGVERIKTIGATVLLATGVPEPQTDHLARAARFALSLRALVAAIGAEESAPLAVRVGLATGPVVAGVVGRTRYAFDVWGDTVNTASRLDSHGAADRIQVSEAAARLLSDHFVLSPRGEVPIKGKGVLRTCWLEGER